MGCDLDYWLDHDFVGLTTDEFLREFKKRTRGTPICFYDTFNKYYKEPAHLPPNRWNFYCYDAPFEKAYDDNYFTMALFHDNKYVGWNLDYSPKTISFFPEDDAFSFTENRRTHWFCVDFLRDRNPEIKKRIDFTLAEIKRVIVPIFHSTKLLVIGDQGYYDETNKMWEGETIDEWLAKDKGIPTEIFTLDSDKRFDDERDYLPALLIDLTKD